MLNHSNHSLVQTQRKKTIVTIILYATCILNVIEEIRGTAYNENQKTSYRKYMTVYLQVYISSSPGLIPMLPALKSGNEPGLSFAWFARTVEPLSNVDTLAWEN